MLPALRRIIATDGHRRRTGRCPVELHSLGTGESFAIIPAADGFTDAGSGIAARCEADGIRLADGGTLIAMVAEDPVVFSGVEPASGERFAVRAHGGATVTLFAQEERGEGSGEEGAYYQFAVVEGA